VKAGVRAEDVAAGRLEQLDALIVPGGGAIAMAGLLALAARHALPTSALAPSCGRRRPPEELPTCA
jgi:hypothetical protein